MNLKFHGIGFFIAIGLLGTATSQEKSTPVARAAGLVFVGEFEGPQITSMVDGARETRLSAAYTHTYGVKNFTDKTWKESGLKWETFSAQSGQIADELALKLKPSYVRNTRGVIEYAIVSGSHPFFNSVITSPGFLKPFTETLGTKLHVVIVDRNVLYVFPATGSNLKLFGPSLVNVFKTTPKPVSLEIFEIDKTGFRVVGELAQQSRLGRIQAKPELIENLPTTEDLR